MTDDWFPPMSEAVSVLCSGFSFEIRLFPIEDMEPLDFPALHVWSLVKFGLIFIRAELNAVSRLRRHREGTSLFVWRGYLSTLDSIYQDSR